MTALEALRAPARLDAARRFLAMLRDGRVDLSRTVMLAAAVLEAPAATVSVVGGERTVVADHGLERQVAVVLDEALGAEVVARAEPLTLDDAVDPADAARVDGTGPRLDVPTPGAEAFRSYLGVPLLDQAGVAVGVLSVLDRRARAWTDRDREMLAALAAAAVSEVMAGLAVSRRERLLDAFESAPVAVAVVRGGDRVLEYLNPAFAELFPLAAHPSGAAARVEDLGLPGMAERVDAVVTSGTVLRDDEQPSSDRRHTATVTYSPIHVVPGVYPDVLLVAVDVTAQVRDRHDTERRAHEQQMLERATAAMQTAVEPAAELEALARSLVPQFADACSAVLLERPVPLGGAPEGDLVGRRVAFASAPDLGAPTPLLEARVTWSRDGLLADAVRAGRPVNEGRLSLVTEQARGAGSQDWVEGVGGVSAAAVPIRVGQEIVGVLVFLSRASRAPFGRADLQVMERVAVRAGAALGQGLAYQRQRDTSLALQRSMLTDAPTVPGLQVVARYRPTAVDTEVGGDWYDAFALPGGDMAVAIGDVAGHDLAAAATMGQLRSMLRALVVDRDGEDPGVLLARLDRAASGLRVTDFTSLVLLRLTPGCPSTLTWSNAGHPPPLVMHADGRAELLDAAAGMVLGVRPDRPRPTATATLEPGATLLLYTDGLVERRGTDDDATIGALVESASAGVGDALDVLCDRLIAGAPVADDVAVLAVRLDGEAGAGATTAPATGAVGLSAPRG